MLLAPLALALAPAQDLLLEERHRALAGFKDSTGAELLADLDGDGDLDLFEGNGSVDRLHFASAGRFIAQRGGLPSNTDPTNDALAGDLDGDGDLDLVLAHGAAEAFPAPLLLPDRVLVNDGTGTFTEVPGVFAPVADVSSALALEDVDGDGDLDLAVASDGGQNRLWFGAPGATFVEAAGVVPPAADATTDVLFFDVEPDGDLDLLFVNTGQPSTLLRNDGAGTFTDVSSLLPQSSNTRLAAAAGDVDGDGDLDVLVPGSLWRNDGAAGFTETFLGYAILGDPEVVLTDVDGDTDLDYLGAFVGLAFGDGAGGFTLANSVLTDGGALAVADIDGDGDEDAVLGRQYVAGFVPGSQLSLMSNRVYLADGSGDFVDATALEPPLPDVDHRAVGCAMGDLDGDGRLDAIVAYEEQSLGSNDPAVQVYRNTGPGTFEGFTGIVPNDATVPSGVELGDADGDGDLDAFVYGRPDFDGSDGGVQLYTNDGAASFTRAFLPGVNTVLDFEAADLDGDGDLDGVAGIDASWDPVNTAYALIGDGAGGFTSDFATFSAVDMTTRDLALADVDGDGIPDALFGNEQGTGPYTVTTGQDRLFLGGGDGSFALAAAALPVDLRATTTLSVGDVDSDGDLDLWVGHEDADALLVNDGFGVFGPSPQPLPSAAVGFADRTFVDLDLDGRLDLLATGPDALFLGSGSGTFTDATSRIPFDHSSGRALAVGDVDGDGDPDALVGCRGELSPNPSFFTGGIGPDRLWANRTRNLAWQRVPTVGSTLELDFCAAPVEVMLLYVSAGSLPLAFPFGTTWLDPSTAKLLAVEPAAANGCRILAYPVPANPGLVGITIFVQGLVAGPVAPFLWATNLELLPLTAW